MERVKLTRLFHEDKQTIGRLNYGFNQIFYTLELPWKDNQRRISCIPKGIYTVVKHKSPTFGPSFWIKDVPGRSEILIHKGNYHSNTLGCILPGLKLADINGDGYRDVTYSSSAMRIMLKDLPDEFELEIK